MEKHNEAISIINEQFGNGKDNVIALATLDLESDNPGPVVRDVDAFYEDGCSTLLRMLLRVRLSNWKRTRKWVYPLILVISIVWGLLRIMVGS